VTGNPGEDAFPNVATREAFGYLTTEPRTWGTVAATVAAIAAHPDGPEDVVTAHLARALQALATAWPGYGEPVDWPAVARVVATCVAEVTDPAPSTPTDAGELTVTLCTACGRWVAMPALTPEVSDETAWALQTEQHWPECPWVLTRGYHIATERAGGERGC
jgi:hypothetical protein